jgi:hypothetical protein
VSAEPVSIIPQCAECAEVWLPAEQVGASALLIGTKDELVFYCPECAELEASD